MVKIIININFWVMRRFWVMMDWFKVMIRLMLGRFGMVMRGLRMVMFRSRGMMDWLRGVRWFRR